MKPNEEHYDILAINEHVEFLSLAVKHFHQWWGISQVAYQKSMEASLIKGAIIPRWYVAIQKNKIIGGLGIIENDFHNRKDLSPNICAVYVEKEFRGRGIAGQLLNRACDDMHQNGVDILYLITDHTSFYERYGWEYYGEVLGNGENKTSRIYIHHYHQ